MEHLNRPSAPLQWCQNGAILLLCPLVIALGGRGLFVPFYSVQDCSSHRSSIVGCSFLFTVLAWRVCSPGVLKFDLDSVRIFSGWILRPRLKPGARHSKHATAILSLCWGIFTDRSFSQAGSVIQVSRMITSKTLRISMDGEHYLHYLLYNPLLTQSPGEKVVWMPNPAECQN